jgi:hypothetical protein
MHQIKESPECRSNNAIAETHQYDIKGSYANYNVLPGQIMNCFQRWIMAKAQKLLPQYTTYW